MRGVVEGGGVVEVEFDGAGVGLGAGKGPVEVEVGGVVLLGLSEALGVVGVVAALEG